MESAELLLKIQQHIDIKIGEVWSGINSRFTSLDGKVSSVGRDMSTCKEGCLKRISELETRMTVRETLNDKKEKESRGIDWNKVPQTCVTALVVSGIMGFAAIVYKIIISHPAVIKQ